MPLAVHRYRISLCIASPSSIDLTTPLVAPSCVLLPVTRSQNESRLLEGYDLCSTFECDIVWGIGLDLDGRSTRVVEILAKEIVRGLCDTV